MFPGEGPNPEPLDLIFNAVPIQLSGRHSSKTIHSIWHLVMTSGMFFETDLLQITYAYIKYVCVFVCIFRVIRKIFADI